MSLNLAILVSGVVLGAVGYHYAVKYIPSLRAWLLRKLKAVEGRIS